MGILGPWPTLIHQFTSKLLAPAPSLVLMLWGVKCCVSRLAGRHQGSQPGRTLLRAPPVSRPGCESLGGSPHPGDAGCTLLHPPRPWPWWGLVGEDAALAVFPRSVASRQTSPPGPMPRQCMLERDGGTDDRIPRGFHREPPTLLGTSRSHVAHGSCPASYQ